MELTRENRGTMLRKIQAVVDAQYFDPAFSSAEWHRLVERHRQSIVDASDIKEFEGAVSRLFEEFSPKTALGLLSAHTAITPRNSIHASFTQETINGNRYWVFQDVLPDGIAAQASVRPGDVVFAVGGKRIAPPSKPSGGPPFTMGDTISMTLGQGQPMTERTVVLTVPTPRYKDNPYAALDPLHLQRLPGGIDHLRVSLFPGKVGIDFANELDSLFRTRLSDSTGLIIDLRGNSGGGIGGLALMSYMTPARLPVGYSRNRQFAMQDRNPATLPVFDKVPRTRFAIPTLALKFFGKSSVFLSTQGMGEAAYKHRMAVLINEHTTGAAEMVAQFAHENELAIIIGTQSPGRLVSRTASKIGHGYRLVLPIAAYVSAKGRQIEGDGVTPNIAVPWSFEDACAGEDNQLKLAVDCLLPR